MRIVLLMSILLTCLIVSCKKKKSTKPKISADEYYDEGLRFFKYYEYKEAAISFGKACDLDLVNGCDEARRNYSQIGDRENMLI